VYYLPTVGVNNRTEGTFEKQLIGCASIYRLSKISCAVYDLGCIMASGLCGRICAPA